MFECLHVYRNRTDLLYRYCILNLQYKNNLVVGYFLLFLFFSLLFKIRSLCFLVGMCRYSHLKGLICAFSFLWDGMGVGNSCCDKSRVACKYRLLDVLIPIGLIRHCSLSFLLYFIHSDTQKFSNGLFHLL